jgi:SAM-dependent methyltransferase
VSNSDYDEDFYAAFRGGVTSSARRIVPLIMSRFAPASVVDVGCGIGEWASVFSECGVSRIVGIDGDHIPRDMLLIPRDCFIAQDLTRPLLLRDRFDLAVCLEVAEHLPPSCADQLVGDLVHLAPTVLFSAAIPHQGGVQHVNERWQSYWAQRFARWGYEPVDVVRPAVWEDFDVMPWYAQNMLIYARREVIERVGGGSLRASLMLDVVAPRFYLYQRPFIERRPTIKAAVRDLLVAVRSSPRFRLERGYGRIRDKW